MPDKSKSKKPKGGDYNLVGDATERGFANLSAQLEPLRQLTPPEVPRLDEEVSVVEVDVIEQDQQA